MNVSSVSTAAPRIPLPTTPPPEAKEAPGPAKVNVADADDKKEVPPPPPPPGRSPLSAAAGKLLDKLV